MQNPILRRDDESISGEQGYAADDGQLLWMDLEYGRMPEVRERDEATLSNLFSRVGAIHSLILCQSFGQT